MCEKHYYYNTTRDGMREKQTRLERCPQALRRGTPCEIPQKFKHPEGERPHSSSYLSSNLPPSPPSSDTSFVQSGSDGERAHKRRSGIYVNGEKVAEMSRKPSKRERRGSNHVVIVEPPKSPRTPPRYVTPMGSPARSPTYIHESRSHPTSSYYTRPEVSFEVNRPRRDSGLRYDYISTPRTARRESHSQGSGSVSDEEARLRQLRRDIKKAEEAKRQAEEAQKKAEDAAERRAKEARKEASRQQKIQSEIRRQNEDIANRPAAPPAPSALKGAYRRGSVSIKQTDALLADAMRNVHIDADEERRWRDKERERRKRDEDAAQKERLRARMAPPPQRSSAVGHGSSSSRRPTVVFNEPY